MHGGCVVSTSLAVTSACEPHSIITRRNFFLLNEYPLKNTTLSSVFVDEPKHCCMGPIQVRPAQLPLLIKSNLCAELLVAIFRALALRPGDVPALDVLESVATAKRFDQTLMFLDDKVRSCFGHCK